MKRDKQLSEKIFNCYFLNVDISLIMHDPHLNIYICIENISVEGTLSQISDIGPRSFSIRLKKTCRNIYKKLPVFFA